MDPSGPWWISMWPDGLWWIPCNLIGSDRSPCDLMDSDGSYLVTMDPHRTWRALMGPSGYLDPTDLDRSLWDLMDSHGTWRVLMDPNGSWWILIIVGTGGPVFTISLSFCGPRRKEKARHIRPRPQKERETVKTGRPFATLILMDPSRWRSILMDSSGF